MSVNLSCLPQSKHLLELYDDVSEVELMGRIGRPTGLLGDNYTTPREIYPEGEPTFTRIDGEEMLKLINSQMGVSAEFLGNTSCQPNTVREVECAMARSEAFWAETSQRNNLMRKVDSRYRDGDWFESCKSDDHD